MSAIRIGASQRNNSTTVDDAFSVKVDANQSVPMRDGTILRADVYRPDASEQFPVLVFRTPYDKRRRDNSHEVYAPVARAVAARGYIVVLQDVRGRFASDGDFVPFFSPLHSEGPDGYDTIKWASALSYGTGKVGTFGDSYGAFTQWELALEQPPNLVAMFPSGLPASAIDSPILRVGRRILWLIARMAPDTRSRAAGERDSGPLEADEAYRIWEELDKGKWYWYLPWRELPASALSGLAPHVRALFDRMPFDYLGYESKHERVDVPVLHLTGWFDISVGGSIAHYAGMVRRAASEQARRNQRLIIGPWTHMDPHYELPRQLGELDFGADAQGDYVATLVSWFDHWLKGIKSEIVEEPPIKLFVMGENRWRYEHEWPLRRTAYTSWYLHSRGAATLSSNDRWLSHDVPADELADHFTYDPRDPVMSLYSRGAYYQPRDQAALGYRADILAYSGPPLTDALEVTGPVTVELFAASSAPDTDFTAKLVDVFPNGKAIGLTCGIVRGRYRDAVDRPSLLEPGRPYQFKIELEPTSYVFGAGHRIRLDISSSDFPNFDRNHNTASNNYIDASLEMAHQTVLHDPTHASRLILPVIPR